MTEKEQILVDCSRRSNSLKALTQYFEKIQFLMIPDTQFSTEDLQELSIFAQYSIHPIYKGRKIYKFYQRLADFYWNALLKSRTQVPEIHKSILQDDQRISIQSHLDYQSDFEKNQVSEKPSQIIQKEEKLEDKNLNLITEAFVQQKQAQKIVSKNYEQITKFMNDFQPLNKQFTDNLVTKIEILKSWNIVSHKLENFTPKKQSQSIKFSKITSKYYLEDIKAPKITHKDSFSCSTIILGKNQSTETKQMKYMLKIQSKKNFVDEKKKQEQSLSILHKKQIQLTYLLNIITKQFFDNFSSQIEKLIYQNAEIITIFCQKILHKVKDEHNFIQIYVKLLKKLCKKSNNIDEKAYSGMLQKKFVSFFQQKFTQLISQDVNYSQQSQQSYVYQKQIIGVCKFIGKLIRQNILSLKIFKFCFWQIVYQYVAKVKQNSQNYITNECLISGIVLISDSIEQKQLRKIMQKQKNNKISEKITKEAFQKKFNALFNPNDQENSYQEQLFDNLIDSVNIQEYPSILNGLMQMFQSKRLKLKFLIEGWSERIKNLQNSPKYEDKFVQKFDNLIMNKNQKQNTFVELIKEINELQQKISINDSNTIRILSPLKKMVQQQGNYLQKFIIQFLNEFANTSKKLIMIKRADLLLQLLNSFNKKATKLLQKCLYLITNTLFEQLMIIECDFPFLVEGLSYILIKIMKELNLRQDQILQKVNFAEDDPDLQDFYQKLQKSVQTMCKSRQD